MFIALNIGNWNSKNEWTPNLHIPTDEYGIVHTSFLLHLMWSFLNAVHSSIVLIACSIILKHLELFKGNNSIIMFLIISYQHLALSIYLWNWYRHWIPDSKMTRIFLPSNHICCIRESKLNEIFHFHHNMILLSDINMRPNKHRVGRK